MTEIDVSSSQIKLMAEQFIWMYNTFYKNSKEGSKIYLDKTKTLYVTHSKFHELLQRWDAWRTANDNKRPVYIVINKVPLPTPVVTSKVCALPTTFIWQPNNYSCGATCLRMIGSRHGNIPDYDDVVKYAGTNPSNGTGHSGMRNTLIKLMGFTSSESVYCKDVSLDKAREKIKQGYDIVINLMTGGLSGWAGNWPHWVLVQCIDDHYVWINDPDKGAMIRHDRSTMEECMDHNGNPDMILAKK